MSYNIKINLENKPQNLKIYADEEMKNEYILNENNVLQLSDYLTYEQAQNIKSNIFYWNWDFEKGKTQEEIEQNDLIDSDFMGKVCNMSIVVEGKQAQSGTQVANVIFDENYFKDDLFTEDKVIQNHASNGGVKNIELISNIYAKYGKSVKVILYNMNNNTKVMGIYIRSNNIPEMKKGNVYTFSVYIKTNTERELRIGNENGGLSYIQTTPKWKKYTNTFIAGNSTNDSGKAFNFYNWGDIWNDDDTLEFHSLELIEGTPSYQIKQILTNTEIGILPQLSRQGYTFEGWYTDPVYGEQVTENTIINESTTIYAHWTYNE